MKIMKSNIYKYLILNLRGLKKRIIVSLSINIIINLFPLLLYSLFGFIIDNYIMNRNKKSLIISGLFLILLLIFNLLLGFYKGIMQGKALQQFRHHLRKNIFSHIQFIDYRFFTKLKFAELNTNIVQDIETFSTIIFTRLVDSLSQIVFFITALIILIKINLTLTLSLFLMIFFFYSIVLKLKKIMGIKFSQFAQARSDLNIIINDITDGIDTIQTCNANSYFINKLSLSNKKYIKKWLAANIFAPSIQSTIEIGILMSYLITFVATGSLLRYQTITYGGIIMFLTYMPQLWDRFRQITDFYSTLQEGNVYLNRIFSLYNYDTYIQYGASNHMITRQKELPILIDKITFSYKSNESIFTNFSLSIEDNGLYCLTGNSGIGKSSLFNLILGLYKPEFGDIYIYGTNIKHLSFTELYSMVGIVNQEIFLINGTVWNNITMGDANIKKRDILKISKEIGFHKYIIILEKGYKTLVGEMGKNISHGLRRMITILRILCRNPKILLLDEVTSNVDSYTDNLLKQLLLKISQEKVCIMITHREKDLVNAKRIIKLD